MDDILDPFWDDMIHYNIDHEEKTLNSFVEHILTYHQGRGHFGIFALTWGITQDLLRDVLDIIDNKHDDLSPHIRTEHKNKISLSNGTIITGGLADAHHVRGHRLSGVLTKGIGNPSNVQNFGTTSGEFWMMVYPTLTPQSGPRNSQIWTID